LEIQETITRVLLERLLVHRPHPWGLIITLLEILKNPTYTFWDLPFVKAAPEVRNLLLALLSNHTDSSSSFEG
jgi:CCR4-NOT transcription complex subunit 1